jgi:hypothetical protein
MHQILSSATTVALQKTAAFVHQHKVLFGQSFILTGVGMVGIHALNLFAAPILVPLGLGVGFGGFAGVVVLAAYHNNRLTRVAVEKFIADQKKTNAPMPAFSVPKITPSFSRKKTNDASDLMVLSTLKDDQSNQPPTPKNPNVK